MLHDGAAGVADNDAGEHERDDGGARDGGDGHGDGDGRGGQPTPTGTVTFFLCQPAQVTANGGDCSTGGDQVGTAVALNGSGQATSAASANTTAIGKYCWRAAYSGDGFYNPSTHTDAVNECFTTVPQGSQTTTQASTNATTVVPGTAVTDTATVTGAAGTPTGTVTFFLCQPAQVTANGGDCSTGGAEVGTAVALNGSGQATSAASANTTAIGKYCWRAAYSGDGFYNPSTHTDAVNECFTTVPQGSQTTTQASTNATTVVPGTAVTDTATVTGAAGTPTGTVTFFLCQPAQVTANGGDCSTGGAEVGTAVALNGSGQATSAASANTTAIGKYCWRAAYSGDGLYNPSTHTDAVNECFTTVPQGSQTTTQASTNSTTVVPGTAVTDTATVTGAAGTPTGTVTFFLCQPSEVTAGQGCVSGGTQVGAAQPLSGGQATSAATTNTTRDRARTAGARCTRGDEVYAPSTHTNAASECFTVVKPPSTTATQASTTRADGGAGDVGDGHGDGDGGGGRRRRGR